MAARAATAAGLWIHPTASFEWLEAREVDLSSAAGYVDRQYVGGVDGSRPVYDEQSARHPDDLAGPFLCEPSPNVPNAWLNFDPLGERDLSTSFARLGELRVGDASSRSAVCEFAKRYGFLGFRMLPIESAGGEVLRFGESLRSWQLEAFKFGSLRTLCRAVRDRKGDAGALEDAMRTVEFARSARDGAGFPLQLRDYGLDDPFIRLDLDPERGTRAAIESARRVARDLLNYQLGQHVSIRVDVRKAPLVLAPRNLLGAIYLQFAFRLNRGALDVQVCANPECQAPLTNARSNKRFCDRKCISRFNYLKKARTGMEE